MGILKVHEHAMNKLSTHVVVNCLQKQMLFASEVCGPCLFAWCWDVKAADVVLHMPAIIRPQKVSAACYGRELCFVAHFLGCCGDITKACQGAQGVLQPRMLTCEGGSQQQPPKVLMSEAASSDSGMLSASFPCPCWAILLDCLASRTTQS